MTSPSPWALQKRISTEMEGSEASKAFIRRRKSTVPVDRHMADSERVPESHPHGGLNHLHGVHLPGFLWQITLILGFLFALLNADAGSDH